MYNIGFQQTEVLAVMMGMKTTSGGTKLQKNERFISKGWFKKLKVN